MHLFTATSDEIPAQFFKKPLGYRSGIFIIDFEQAFTNQ